jgi:hypothetical protein
MRLPPYDQMVNTIYRMRAAYMTQRYFSRKSNALAAQKWNTEANRLYSVIQTWIDELDHRADSTESAKVATAYRQRARDLRCALVEAWRD